jgi:hypothetical protein
MRFLFLLLAGQHCRSGLLASVVWTCQCRVIHSRQFEQPDIVQIHEPAGRAREADEVVSCQDKALLPLVHDRLRSCICLGVD